jgi:hypothetical protein
MGLALAGFSAGCNSSTAPMSGMADEVSPDKYPPLVVSESIRPFLRFGDPMVNSPDDDHPLHVIWPVRNISHQMIHVRYRFEFFDADRRPLTDGIRWRSADLPPGGVETTMEAGAMYNTAQKSRLIVEPQL